MMQTCSPGRSSKRATDFGAWPNTGRRPRPKTPAARKMTNDECLMTKECLIPNDEWALTGGDNSVFVISHSFVCGGRSSLRDVRRVNSVGGEFFQGHELQGGDVRRGENHGWGDSGF